MNPELDDLIAKAAESLDAAETLFQQKFHDFAASRAYYTMFYLAQAALFTKGLSYSKHSAVIAAFGKEFAKAGLIDAKYHQYLMNAYDTRTVGDYAVGAHVSAEVARRTLDQAKEFLVALLGYLKGPQGSE
ncbi:MAG: HEPN domain-containing protein [Nitrospirae bacterium]|nr:HEPN domain-containing protein [Nitrospirota bacterium]